MGLDVHVHLANKKGELIKENVLDFLPYRLRWSFWPEMAEDTYVNIADVYRITEPDELPVKFERLADQVVDKFNLWVTAVKVADVHALMDYDKEFEFEDVRKLDPELVMLVEGDDWGDNICGSATRNGMKFGARDEDFFKDVDSSTEKNSESIASILDNCLK